MDASTDPLMPKAARALRRGPPSTLGGPLGWLAGVGLAWRTLLECLTLYGNIIIGRERLDLPAFTAALRQAGLSILPAVTLVTAALGVILGRQAGKVLESFNFPGALLFTITYAVVIELVPILVGVLVAGRAGVALAVRHATLVVTGQMDGLLVSGINPIRFVTGPTLLAMLAMSFAFLVWGSLVTVGAAYLWLFFFSDVPPYQLIDAVRSTLGPGDVREAVTKPLVFAVVIALIATVNGTVAGRDPEAIGEAATRTMIAAVTSILLIDLLFVLWPEG
ncbi:MAG: ABC transporter permease [Thiohalocapsa sp.]|jgi:phospholipid/cholesterol/gamma-HCH transport system permease protein|uniref:MlaE family ABC transporter permease n=1 Tax=Thiohalocapsa sp. TaxID=2497641 RepID=UPI0025FFFEE2|nr:ABC transporter permease [Thiohalocapsa sp.]MCG6942647.1 ABC transporter permease [Thiohalocapsa sp.]